jgi:hypothetical protein
MTRLFFSARPWAATAYLAGSLLILPVLFIVTVTVCSLAYAMSIVWLGLPMLIGAAGIVRGCAQFERRRAGLVGDAIPTAYREIPDGGLVNQIKARWGDPATRRDCAYLMVLSLPLVVLDTFVLIVWLVVVGMITVPLWYYTIPQSWDNGMHAHGVMLGYRADGPHSGAGFGIWIGDVGSALIAALCFLVVAVFASHLVVGTARLHARVARSLLGPYVDPLAQAKAMLTRPQVMTH